MLPLEEPAAIAHARALIASGGAGPEPIVVAEIEAGADGINRDVLAPGQPLWSWHVAGFSKFVDATVEIYDGTPGLVEADVDWWIENTRERPDGPGIIAFWSYTVVGELPEPGSQATVAGALAALGLVARRRRARDRTAPRRAASRRRDLGAAGSR